ncbi:retrovirus-related pol polyprotein from transposon TNT 1-94 [Tanacetum coccineum]
MGYDNQRELMLAGAREIVGTPVVQKSGFSVITVRNDKACIRGMVKTKTVVKNKRIGRMLLMMSLMISELEARYMYMAQLQDRLRHCSIFVDNSDQSLMMLQCISFAKPEFLKKAQRANPRLYDIGCYNDNLALMLAPDSDETIRLDKERRSKLSDLIRPFDYDQLNNLYDLFVPQREKSAEQHYFPKTSKMSHTSSNKEFSKESFRKQTTLLEKRMDESIPWDQKCKSSKELFKIKKSVDTIFDGVERCKQTIANETYFGNTGKMMNSCKELSKVRTLSKRVIPTTSVSRPQLKSNQMEDRVMLTIVKGKKQNSRRDHSYYRRLGVRAMTENLKLLTNFVEKISGITVEFRNDSNCTQFLARRSLGNDLLIGSYGTDLYSITLPDSTSPNPICLMAKATSSQAWLWHRRLSHLNFDTINLLSKNNIVNGLPKLKFVKDHLCSSCELGKAKRKSFHTKTTSSSKRRLQLLHMDLCGPIRVESINGKKYVLVIVDDYSRYTWTHFLRSKDETPGVLIDFLTLNRTLVEAARTMLSAAKVPLFFWAEAIATTCFTQNRSLVIPQHEKTYYHIINARKPSVKFFHIFGSLCYIVRDGENLDKMKEKGDACIFVGYSTQSKAYRVFNKRTRMIVETIHVNFDELPQMASDHVSSDPGPQCSTTVLEQDSLSPDHQSQENVSQTAETETTSNELELLYSLMFSELLNGTSPIVSKSSAVHAADNPDKRQQHNTTHTSTTTDVADPPPLNIQSTHQTPTQVPTVTAPENIIQA